MNVRTLIRRRLKELNMEQRELAAAAKVTDSYVSQLLARRKPPPAPERTDIYAKMERALKLPPSSLSELAEQERLEEWQKRFAGPLPPLLEQLRELVLRKCSRAQVEEMTTIFQKEPLGVVEHIVVLKLLEVVKRIVREDLKNERWLQTVARLSGRSYEELRVLGLEFLDTDLFSVTIGDCQAFLDPLVDSWEMDLTTFSLQIVLNEHLVRDPVYRFEFVEQSSEGDPEQLAGLNELLEDQGLNPGATEEEIAFLRQLRFPGKTPTALYYYRALQDLRDPIHFRPLLPDGKGSSRKSRGTRARQRREHWRQ